VPTELTVIALTALLAGLLLVAVMLAGRRGGTDRWADPAGPPALVGTSATGGARADGDLPATDATLRVVWWLTTTIVLLGVGISGSFATDQAPIFVLGGAAALSVVAFHEIGRSAPRGRLSRLVELLIAVALIAGLLAMTGFAASPFVILFALVAVAAALGHGPRAGLLAAGLATVALGAVVAVDPSVATYGADDLLQIGIRLGAIWLLAFISVVYADHQRRTVQRAIALSRTDPLTGLFNRSQLSVILEQEVSRTRRSDRGFCVLMIDLDGLKTINDTAGHLRGDQVLHALGRVIAGSIRTVDSAYRYGGDEFVVLLPETDIVGAFVVAEKIRVGAEELELSLGDAGQASVSIGLVSHPEDGLNAEELMVAADRAMYQAKSLGKNQISGNPRPRPALLARRSVLEPAPSAPSTSPIPEATAVAAAVAAPVPPPTPPAVITPPAPRPAEPDEASDLVAPLVDDGPPAPASMPDAPVGPADDRAVAVPLGPAVESRQPGEAAEAAVAVEAGVAAEAAEAAEAADRASLELGDAEPDPQEVRRRIATASRSFDPDDQVRRAMDAFFSPSVPPREDRTTPEH
jgi:diguanylate cyclase (GGDEF)-like protein